VAVVGKQQSIHVANRQFIVVSVNEQAATVQRWCGKEEADAVVRCGEGVRTRQEKGCTARSSGGERVDE